MKKYRVWLFYVLVLCLAFAMPVQAASVKKVKLNKKKATVYVGKTLKLKATVKPAAASNAKITWKSSNSKVAKITNGTVKGIKAGKATITAKAANGKKATCKITVKEIKAKSVTLNKTSLQMNVGETYKLNATIKPSDTTNKTLKWSSSNKNVVKVSNGTLTAKKAGSATITVKTSNGKKAKCKVTVSVSNKVNKVSDDSFMKSVSVMTKKAAQEGTFGMSVMSSGYSRRLIVKSRGNDLDFSKFNPDKVVASNDHVYFVQFSTASAAKKCFNSLSNDSRVKYVEYDDYLAADTDISSNAVGVNAKSWGVSVIGADSMAQFVAGKTSSSITVAVVDTGVASNHSFLSGRIASGGYDLVDGDSTANDAHGHGTHVAGTVVDCTPGLKVKILPVRVLDADGRGTSGNVANGIRYAVRQGAKVINLSLGGGTSNYIDEAIRYAVNQGVTVVCAAGNENSQTRYYSPAHMSEAIVVAACDSNGQRAYFSNYGNSVDLIAPGVEIISCVPGGSYQRMNGTSMASPHVAGLAAMVKLLYPSYTPSQVETFLKKYTTDLGSTGTDIYYGSGRPNMKKALDVLDQKGSISLKTNATSGSSITLTATTVPAGRSVTWSTSNSTVATVNNGVVTAKSAGTAKITAKMTYNGKTYSASKTVTVGSANSYGSWSGWTMTPISATSTRQVETTTASIYRYYYFACPNCGARDPFSGKCSGCNYYLTGGNWVETWSTVPYANCGSAIWPEQRSKRYTYNLDGRIWYFSAGNVYHTAPGTLDATGSGGMVIKNATLYRHRSKYTTAHITSVV